MEAALLVVVLLFSGLNTLGGGSSSKTNKVQLLTDGSPYVQLQHGLYFGKTLSSRKEEPYYAFMGIRYAATPKRFEKSVLMSELDSMPLPVLAQSMGSACPQISADGAFAGKEDCLFANVYVPARDPIDEDGFPVIVFIHPGSYNSGSGNIDVSFFMDEDVIYTTFNFRLGALGFLSTEDGIIPGNLGLHDQIVFLEWVRENIEEFGGNKGRVTISGVEAGAASVQHLIFASHHSQGLFQSAIVHGGSALTSYLPNPMEFTKQVCDELECPHQPSRLLAECLKIKRLRDLIEIQRSVSEKYLNFSSPFLPSSEQCRRVNQCTEAFLAKSPVLLLSERKYKRVPLLIGMKPDVRLDEFIDDLVHDVNPFPPGRSTEGEAFFGHLESIQKHVPTFLNKDFSSSSRDIERLYFQKHSNNNTIETTKRSLSSFLYDTLVMYGVWKFAMIYAQDKPVYPYIITFQGSNKSIVHGNSIDGNEGMLGGTEFLTPSLPEHHEFERGSDEEIFSQHLVHLWAAFATHLKPVDVWQNKETWLPLSASQLNGEKPVTWYALDKKVVQIEEPFTRRMKFLDKVFKQTV